MSDDFFSFLEEAGGAHKTRVMERLGDGYYQLEITEAQKRQAEDDIRSVEDGLRELLRNARDGRATKVFIATKRIGNKRVLSVIDNGQGIPAKYHSLVFEPRVTSRLDTAHTDYWGFHGRGMALYSIKSRFQTCELVFSEPDQGTRVYLEAETEALSENSEQSVMPELIGSGENESLRGPHNLARLAAEFALYEQGRITVYFGSLAEIAATLVENAEFGASFQNAKELRMWAERFGLNLSERTAARVYAKSILPVKPLLELLREKRGKAQKTSASLDDDKRKTSISNADKDALSSAVEPACKKFLEAYYLQLAGKPSVTVKKNKLVISCAIEREWD